MIGSSNIERLVKGKEKLHAILEEITKPPKKHSRSRTRHMKETKRKGRYLGYGKKSIPGRPTPKSPDDEFENKVV